MNFALFTPDDWKEFRETHPQAYRLLGKIALRAERRAGHQELKSKYCTGVRREWLQSRIDELDAIHDVDLSTATYGDLQG